MREYTRNGQYGDLSEAVDKATKRRSGRKKGKGALIAATLIAGGLIGGGLALVNSGDVPPHEERVEYITKNHRGAHFFLPYKSPGFQKATFSVPRNGAIHTVLDLDFWKYSHMMEFVDNSADGTLDRISAEDVWKGGKGKVIACSADFGQLPESMQEKYSDHYENSSEAIYLYFTDDKDSLESNITDTDVYDFLTFCETL